MTAREESRLAAIDTMRREVAAIEANLEIQVRRALADGIPVSKVAAALGVSRQAVHERFVKRATG